MLFATIDRLGIFALIAGSYTPIAWTLLDGRWRRWTLRLTWLTAAAGALLHCSCGRMPIGLSTALYLAMGWGCFFCYLEMARARLAPRPAADPGRRRDLQRRGGAEPAGMAGPLAGGLRRPRAVPPVRPGRQPDPLHVHPPRRRAGPGRDGAARDSAGVPVWKPEPGRRPGRGRSGALGRPSPPGGRRPPPLTGPRSSTRHRGWVLAILDPEQSEDGDQRQRRPLVAGQAQRQDRLGADELGGEPVDQVRQDVELDELPAEQAAPQEPGQDRRGREVEGELVELRRVPAAGRRRSRRPRAGSWPRRSSSRR